MGAVHEALSAGNLLNDLTVNRDGNAGVEMARVLHDPGVPVHAAPVGKRKSITVPEEGNMWTKPDFTEMRFGFEITMYIGNR